MNTSHIIKQNNRVIVKTYSTDLHGFYSRKITYFKIGRDGIALISDKHYILDNGNWILLPHKNGYKFFGFVVSFGKIKG